MLKTVFTVLWVLALIAWLFFIIKGMATEKWIALSLMIVFLIGRKVTENQ